MNHLIYIWFLLMLVGCEKERPKTERPISATLLLAPDISEVGSAVEFQFTFEGNQAPMLFLENSFGPKLFKPNISGGKATFQIGEEHTKQSGLYHWQLITNTEPLSSGSFQLNPKNEAHKIETYFGPRSIRAGGIDYSMLAVMPTDVFDNPLSDGTQIEITKQLDDKTIVNSSALRNGFYCKLLYGEEKIGRMLVSAAVNGTASKELTSTISPSNATDFTIAYERVHEFADGNQVISFKTIPIMDRFGNAVSDGTLVNFVITNKRGIRLQTTGTTMAGVATGRLLHPEAADEWKVNAFVTGEAKSQSLSLSFKPTVTSFEVAFSSDNRQINIGPVVGFMEQLIPDGLQIQLMIYSDSGTLLETKTTNSKSGKGRFSLKEGFFPEGNYMLKVQLAGLEKKFKRTLGNNEME